MPALAHRVQFVVPRPVQPIERSHSSLHRSHTPIVSSALGRTINESLNNTVIVKISNILL